MTTEIETRLTDSRFACRTTRLDNRVETDLTQLVDRVDKQLIPTIELTKTTRPTLRADMPTVSEWIGLCCMH